MDRALRPCVLVFAWLVMACGAQQDGPFDSRPALRGELGAGSVARGVLEDASVVRYSVELAAGDAIGLVIDQKQLDLVVRLSESSGEVILTVDSPTGTMTPEKVCWVAETGGTYSVDIAPYVGSGAFVLEVAYLRPAIQQDRDCVEAATAFAAAQVTAAREERLELFRRAARSWGAAEEPLLASIAWRQTGQLLLEAGATAAALESLERALRWARQSGNSRLEVSVLNRLGLAYQDAGEMERSGESLDQALSIASRNDDLHGLAASLTNRGLVDEEVGEPHLAVARYRAAVDLWRQLEDPAELAQTLDNLAATLGVLDHHDEALDALNEALVLARRAGSTAREANVLASIGWIHYLGGDPVEGIGPLQQARELRRVLGDSKGEAGVLDRLGTVLRKAGRPQAAEESYLASLAISERMDLPGYRAATQSNLGCLLAQTRRSHEAAALLAKALSYFDLADDPKSRSQVEYCLARQARHEGRVDSALKHVGRALAIVEDLRRTARLSGHHYQPIWLWQDYAELEVDLLLDRHEEKGDPEDLAAAFEAADRMEARTLYELVVRTRAGAEQAASRAHDERAQRLQSRLNELGARRSERLSSSGSADSTTDLDAEIRSVRLQLEDLEAERRAAAREAGLLDLPRPVSTAEAQGLLDSETVMLSYVLGSEESHLLALSSDRLDVFRLPSREVLEAHAEAFYHALRDSLHGESQWLHASSSLGRLLIPEGVVRPHVKRLMVMPAGALHYVPFAALRSPRSTSSTALEGRLVLDDFEVVTIPSASVLAGLRARADARTPRAKTVAVVADPVFSVDDHQGRREVNADSAGERGQRAIEADRLPAGNLPRLPATALEAASILARVDRDQRLALLGEDATKAAVLSADLRSYRILHFATHAWIDERFPELSGLVLSMVDGEGREIDGALYLHEIDRLDLAASLTVLSGCQTALGRRVRGDGLRGLTQGFFRAGSSQLLVSLWSLDDSAAAELMDEFYRRILEEGETPAEALRHAQGWLRRQDGLEAPRFWAPYVLQGDG